MDYSRKINLWLNENRENIINIRRHIHSHPELGFHEYQTAKYLKSLLRKSGYKIKTNEKMRTGFYCEYGKAVKPILAFRADLDALPITDTKVVEYKSLNTGIMHACGHDVHMSIVTALALYLAEEKPNINGKIRFIFQPAEEVLNGGALKMIESGAVDNVDAIIGVHVLPSLKAGKIGIKKGTISAAVSLLEIYLYGKGGHTSRPEETQNLVSVAADLIKELEKYFDEKSREEKSPYVLGFGEIKGGETFNVIPTGLLLRGSIRFLTTGQKKQLEKEILIIINRISKKHKTKIEIKFPYFVPAVYNDEEVTNMAIRAARKAIGKNNVVLLEKSSMGSDDFGYYSDRTKTLFIRVGSMKKGVVDLHTANFDVNEKVIPTAVKVLLNLIDEFYSKT